MDEESNINSGSAVKDSTSGPKDHLFAPNLSLNVGIKKHSRYMFWVVAVLGFLLQYTVVVYTVIMTYRLKWKKNGCIPESYAFPLMIIGTSIFCPRVFFCAYFVGQSTNEQVFLKQTQL